HLKCPACGLNNRMRALVHLLEERLAVPTVARTYINEQQTPCYRWMAARYPSIIGSEYLGEALPFGKCDERGLRNETVTGLTFPDATFELVVSQDVLEHVPDFRLGLRELHRVLRPGGSFVF